MLDLQNFQEVESIIPVANFVVRENEILRKKETEGEKKRKRTGNSHRKKVKKRRNSRQRRSWSDGTSTQGHFVTLQVADAVDIIPTYT